MAVAKNDSTDATRIRDNQRRSRARRKEYIQELEQRARECELRDAEASKHLQVAAQKVARENEQLRLLLRRHGVSSTEIDACMEKKSDDSQVPVNDRETQVALTFQDPPIPSMVQAPIQDDSNRTIAPIEAPSRQNPSEPTVAHPDPSDLSIVSDTTSQSRSLHAFSTPNHLNNRPVRQDESAQQNSAANLDDATSCETAAWIIANLRGHDDTDEVRTELGCPSKEDCTVKNLKVFNAMDR